MKLTTTRITHFLFAACLICASTIGHAAVIYVNSAAVGTNDGTDWLNAFTSLESALAIAENGDEIWVAQGTYTPTLQVDINSSGGNDPREVTFQIPSGVMLFGGFTGTEMNKDERDWIINRTILSGDIDDNDVLTDGIVQTTDGIVGNNAYHVVHTVNVSTGTGMDGFIVTGGSASPDAPLSPQDPNRDGGGWYNRLASPINASSPSITNTLFSGNYAASEGGAFFCNIDVTGGEVVSEVRFCQFSYNKSGESGGAVFLGSFQPGNYAPLIQRCEFQHNESFRRGGALYMVGDHAIVDSTTFTDNHVTAISPDMSTLTGSGGATSLVSSNAHFTTCYFMNNSATGNPTGPYEGGGGGAVYISANEPQTILLGPSEPRFFNCGFYDNIASGNTTAWGGAVVHLSDAGILDVSYVNCVFGGNEAQNHGGAVATFTRVISAEGFTPLMSAHYTNCTFAGNHAGQFGGALYHDGYMHMGSEILDVMVVNSVLSTNTATTEGPQVYNMDGDVEFSFSLIAGSNGSGGGWDTDVGIDGGGNIDFLPLFVNPADPLGADDLPGTDDDGLRVDGTSPAVNTGNGATPGLLGVTIDFRGNPRVLGPQVDMGAYERGGITLPDFDLYWLYEWRPILPPCLSCPWSILLADQYFRGFVWDGPAQLIDHGDYAEIIGTVINTRNRRITFDVYVKLVEPADWSVWERLNRTWWVFTPAALKVAYKGHKEWKYWELSDGSFLVGTGEVKGSLRLSHYPSNFRTGFQLGAGANGWDADQGLGGFFSYEGKVAFGDRSFKLKGLGSLNVDAVLCTEGCEPKEPQQHDRIALADEIEIRSEVFAFPNPARDRIEIKTETIEGAYLITIYNERGEQRQVESASAIDGSISLDLKNLQPGLYYLSTHSENGVTRRQKLIVE